MRQTYFKVMVEHEGYEHIEQDGLTLEEAHELLDRMNRIFPDEYYWIDEGKDPNNDEYEQRTYSRHAADGWEDFYDTDEG
jgi:hypothetical protein